MKNFFLKITLFIILIAGIQALLPLPYDVRYKMSKMDYVLRFKPDVIFFGDSTLKWTSPKDPAPIAMPDLLKMLLPKAVLIKLVHPSYQMDVYRMHVHYFLNQGYYPKYFIIPINLRSFSPEWYRQPRWQFEEERWLLAFHERKLLKFFKPVSVFKIAGQKISRYEYLRTPVYNGSVKVGYVKDFDNSSYKNFSPENMKNKMMFRYMYRLTADHPYVRAMREIALEAARHGVGVIFYLTPIDCQSGQKYWGEAFTARVRENAGLIKDELAGTHAAALDLSRALSTAYFSWPDDDPSPVYPNEHLNLKGRLFVVQQLYSQTGLQALSPHK